MEEPCAALMPKRKLVVRKATPGDMVRQATPGDMVRQATPVAMVSQATPGDMGRQATPGDMVRQATSVNCSQVLDEDFLMQGTTAKDYIFQNVVSSGRQPGQADMQLGGVDARCGLKQRTASY
jgi:hypothetical protein